ncbi:geranylgeranylglyceryl/heptaprenylglyceryl phosphate synthase [Candidatus Bathyarchaeota archaeon ex4484_205]|nr:MAG: geranylgeranylglyceryl/heptaprenylglyceryl phosphate synthase [Candidatus Bathyarchaeota archaeon ex4484_205]RLG69441.1 MAG: geranylgeranylglyceryl/heptaprenylglyceryl phosphate synthase [archaeon]
MNVKNSTFNYLIEKLKQKGALYFILVDPDKPDHLDKLCDIAEEADVAAFLVGGSTVISQYSIHNVIQYIKKITKIPVIIFPSNVSSVAKGADAIFFMSLLNSRNPYYISRVQAVAAPTIKKLGLEPISLAYIIVGDGGAAGYIGEADPIPFDHPELAAMYALSAELIGFKLIYLEAGSGVKEPIPPYFISFVKKIVNLPIIVGGGLINSENIKNAVKAGADIIVTGNVMENDPNCRKKILEFANAVKEGVKERKIK